MTTEAQITRTEHIEILNGGPINPSLGESMENTEIAPGTPGLIKHVPSHSGSARYQADQVTRTTKARVFARAAYDGAPEVEFRRDNLRQYGEKTWRADELIVDPAAIAKISEQQAAEQARARLEGRAQVALSDIRKLFEGYSLRRMQACCQEVNLGALLKASLVGLTVMKWVGGAYLVWLGIQVWRSPPIGIDVEASAQPRTGFSLFRQGALSALTNPARSLFGQFVIMAGTFAVIEIAIELLIASMAHRISPWLRRVGRRFNQACGGVFMAIGLALPLRA